MLDMIRNDRSNIIHYRVTIQGRELLPCNRAMPKSFTKVNPSEYISIGPKRLRRRDVAHVCRFCKNWYDEYNNTAEMRRWKRAQ